MENTCVDCSYVIHKETKKSKIPYGYCKKLNLAMISVQNNCKLHKKQELNNGVA